MAKKSSLLLAAVVVLVFAVPAMASAAAPTLHEEGGGLVEVPSTVVLEGSNVVITSSSLGEIKCTSITLEGELTVNDTTNGVTGSANDTSPPTTDCTNGTNTVNVTNVIITSLKSKVNGVVQFSFTEEVDIGTSTKCKFTGNIVAGSYVNNGSTVTFSSASGITSSPVACGTAKLDGSFSLRSIFGRIRTWLFG